MAPLSILGVWEEEFQKFAAFPYALAVLSGSSAKKLDTLRHMTGTALQVVVVNYESAWRLEKALTAWHPDLIIADEGHKIKTHNIAASKAMHRMGAKASYRLLLTGTVITNKAIENLTPTTSNLIEVQIDDNSFNQTATLDIYNEDDLKQFITWNQKQSKLHSLSKTFATYASVWHTSALFLLQQTRK